MKLLVKQPKNWVDFYWLIFDSAVRPEYYLDVHNLLAQPAGSTIKYNYNKDLFSSDGLKQAEKKLLGNYVLFAYTQYRGFRRAEDIERFKANDPKWHCATRYGRMVGITEVDDFFLLDIQLGGYPDPHNKDFATLMSTLESSHEVPFDKFVLARSEWAPFGSETLVDTAEDKRNWAEIVRQLDKFSQFQGDSFWRLAGPFEFRSNKLVPLRRLKLGRGNIIQYRFRESERAYFILQNQESGTKEVGPDVARRFVSVSVSDIALQSGDSQIDLRQYFETTLFFRAVRQESLRPAEPVIVFSTSETVKNPYPCGASFKLPIRVERNNIRLAAGAFLAWCGAVLAMIALHENVSYDDIAEFGVALVLLATASVLLYDKLKIGAAGGD